MADFAVERNGYGEYGIRDDIVQDEQHYMLFNGGIYGTIDDITNDYLNGNFSYSDDFYALLHDVYGDYSEFPEELQDDLEITCAAIKFNDDYSIDKLSPDALDNKEIVMALLDEVDSRSNEHDKYNSFMRLFNAGVGSEALADKEVALRWVNYRADNLQDVSPELRDDKEVVLTAVKHDSQALKYASDRLKDDIEVVTAALRETDCYGLLYASDRLKDNEEFVKLAMTKNDAYLKFASERIQDIDRASNNIDTLIDKSSWSDKDKQTMKNLFKSLDEMKSPNKQQSLDDVIKNAKNKASGNPDHNNPNKDKSR